VDHYNIKATFDQKDIMWKVHCEPPMKVIHVSSCLYLISKIYMITNARLLLRNFVY